MARRDRKRKRNQGKPGTEPGGSRARDIGFDDPSVDEAGIGDPAAAPDPLKNASAEVDQARAAETGAHRPPPGEPIEDGDDVILDEADSDYVAAPDEVEGDLLPQSRGGPVDPAVAAERAEAARPQKDRGKVVTFLRNVVEELRRVQWPDRRHTGQATAVTLGFVVIAGAFLGLMDAIWRPIVNAII